MKAVTSLLVKQWDDHYTKMQQDNEQALAAEVKRKSSERTIPKQMFYTPETLTSDENPAKSEYNSMFRRTTSQISITDSESTTPQASDDESDETTLGDKTPTNSDNEGLSSDDSDSSSLPLSEGQKKVRIQITL